MRNTLTRLVTVVACCWIFNSGAASLPVTAANNLRSTPPWSTASLLEQTDPVTYETIQAASGAEIQATTPMTFTVTVDSDEPDAAPGNGVCATSGGACTLRAAIQEVNARDSGDTIRFSINPGGTSVLPRIIQPVISTTAMVILVKVSIIGPNATTIPGAQGAPIYIDGSKSFTNSAWSGFDIANTRDVRIANVTIYGFPGDGITIRNSSFVTVTGSVIGYKPAGVGTGQGNAQNGIRVVNSNNCQIGGRTTGSRNIISGNEYNGIYIYNSSSITVEGNYIGLDTTGTTAVPNAADGIWLSGSYNQIGGSTSGARNIISGNTQKGIRLQGIGEIDVTGNRIQGNYVGLNADGTAAVPNAGGFSISVKAYGNLIGGRSTEGEGNTISGNTGNGMYITSNDPHGGNIVRGNKIGTNPAGTVAIPNTSDGILVERSPGNQIGGADPGLGNLVSGNLSDGITIYYSESVDNFVSANRIGVSSTGTPLGNGGNGIKLLAYGNTIGNTNSGPGSAGNVIAYNAGAGIAYYLSNTFYGNSIYSNGRLEIDYYDDGATANNLSGDKIPQNYPVLTQAIVSGSTVTITGSLVTSPNISITLEFFVSDGYDPSGCGQGQAYVGNKIVAVGPSGTAVFTTTLTHGSVRQGVYAATATSTALGTSEFSCAPFRIFVPLTLKNQVSTAL
ncbi:MAG: right-handed parallel beta-helix repeat-containing protein [Anaerolineae bacterium]